MGHDPVCKEPLPARYVDFHSRNFLRLADIPGSPAMSAIPGDCLFQSFAERSARLPTQLAFRFAHIEQAARLAVRPARIPKNFSRELRDFGEDVDHIGDTGFLPG